MLKLMSLHRNCLLFGILIFFFSCTTRHPGLIVTRDMLKELDVRPMSSFYFDQAMGYRNSRFLTVAFSDLLDRYDPEGGSDAVLLECLDDYQGVLSVADIRAYDLRLATEIHLSLGANRPGWLNALLVIVPDGSRAPLQERFMTANIRSLRFVKLVEYYAPLDGVAGTDELAGSGLKVFEDNCLFCHSVNGVGGGKGGSLQDRFDFSSEPERGRFQKHFRQFHDKNNPDKQTVSEFISDGQLDALTRFLALVR